jgi:hypothetical protein
LTCPSDFSNRDLFFSGCQIGSVSIPQTAVPLPGVLVKLNATVETVAGVDGPITSGFTPGKGVPGTSVGDFRNFCTGLHTHPQNRVSSRDDDDIGYWHPAGFDTVDPSYSKRHVLRAGRARVLDDLAAHIQ